MNKHWYRKPRYEPPDKCERCGQPYTTNVAVSRGETVNICNNPQCGTFKEPLHWRHMQKGKAEAIDGNLCASVYKDGRIYRWQLVSLLDTGVTISKGWESDEQTAKERAETSLNIRKGSKFYAIT